MFSLFKKNSIDVSISLFLREILGFSPNNIELYKIAFIHRSASISNPVCGKLNNERLEYLGDAILSAIVADYLYKKYPFENEGFLTQKRSKIVCRNRLNSLAHTLGMDNFISHENGNQPKCANGDAFEALIGAIFLDKGYEKTKKIFLNLIHTHLDLETIFAEEDNYKSIVLNWGQRHNKEIHFEHIITILNNKKMYKALVIVDNITLGEGLDYTIKKAEQAASANTWEKINIDEK